MFLKIEQFQNKNWILAVSKNKTYAKKGYYIGEKAVYPSSEVKQ